MLHKKNLYLFGVLAALSTVTIWAMFLIGTRFAVSGNLTVDEVLVLSGRPAKLQYKLKVDLSKNRKIEDLYSAKSSRTLGILRKQIEIGQFI